MPTTPENCVNYALNQQMCPCVSVDCQNHGICCECMESHRTSGEPTACMRGVARDEATLDFLKRAVAKCLSNLERNLALCICKSDTCERKGTCCNCVRAHWKVDGTGRVACMRAFA